MKTTLVPVVVAGTLALFSTPAAVGAEDSLYGKEYATCMDRATSTASMVECIEKEHESQDARLNQAYKKLLDGLSNERQKELRDVQRLWISYRDANCKFVYDPDGGTISRLEANMCVLSMTAQRASELEQYGQTDVDGGQQK